MNAFKRKISNCLWENKTKVNNNLLILTITFANIEAPIFGQEKNPDPERVHFKISLWAFDTSALNMSLGKPKTRDLIEPQCISL